MMLKVQLVVLTLAQASNVVVNGQKSQVAPNDGKTTVDGQQLGLSSTLIDEYKQKICNHSDTCSLVNLVPPSFRDLRTRNCMCDENCTLYDDCCKDSKFQTNQTNKGNFSCEKTASNGFIYMKTSCPLSWNKSITIREHCETVNPQLLTLDVFILTPVTNKKTGITYRNMFCAFCHEDDNFDFWDLGLTCKFKNTSEQLSVEFSNFDESILPNLTPNEAAPGFWEYIVDNTTYQCLYHGKFLEDAKFLRPCVPSVVDTCSSNWTDSSNCSHYTSYIYVGDKVYKNLDCLTCNYLPQPSTCTQPPSVKQISSPLTIDILHKNIKKIPRCDEIPKHSYIYKTICPETVRVTPECYRSKCLISEYYDIQSDIEFIDNETIYVKSRDMKFPQSEYTQLSNSTIIFVCGRTIPRTKIQQIVDQLDDWISEILIKISIICLLAHLLIFQQLPEMKNLSGKNLAVFCFTLLVSFLCFEVGPWLPSCEIVAVILHYSLLSCFTWMLIMSYDCWLSLYRATKQFRAAGGKHSTKFIIYCTISWIIPLLVVSVAVYYELSPSSVVPCEKKPGYGKYGSCFISQLSGFVKFFIIPASIMFLGNICFFAHTAYMIFLSQRSTVNPNTRNDFKLYTRLAVMMGLTWTLGTLVFFTDNLIIILLFSILNMSQGIFIFFGFTFKQKTLKQLRTKHQNNSTVSRFLSTFSNDTVSESVTQQTQMDSLKM